MSGRLQNARARLAAVWTSGTPGDRNQADRRGGSFFPKNLAREMARYRPEYTGLWMWESDERACGTTSAPPWNRTKNLLIKSHKGGLSHQENQGMAPPESGQNRPVVSREVSRTSATRAGVA